MTDVYKTWSENMKGRYHIGDLFVHENIIHEQFWENWSLKMWTG
jgi:hypothetical protein